MSDENYTCEHCGKTYKSETGLKAHQGHYPSKPMSCKVLKSQGLEDKENDTVPDWNDFNPNEVVPDPEDIVGSEEVVESETKTTESSPDWMKWQPSNRTAEQGVTHKINPAVSLFKKQMDSTIEANIQETVDPALIREMNSSIIKLIPPITDVALSAGAKVLSDGKIDMVKHSEADRQLWADSLELYASSNDMDLSKHASPGLLLGIVTANYVGVPLWEAARESPLTIKERIGNFGMRFRIPVLKRWARKNNAPDFVQQGIAHARTGTIPGGDL